MISKDIILYAVSTVLAIILFIFLVDRAFDNKNLELRQDCLEKVGIEKIENITFKCFDRVEVKSLMYPHYIFEFCSEKAYRITCGVKG